MDLGSVFFDSFKRKLVCGLDQKFGQLEQLQSDRAVENSSNDGAWDMNLLQMMWEEFPRRSSFFVGGMRDWISQYPDGFLQSVFGRVLVWGEFPFSLSSKLAGIRVKDRHLEVLANHVWSRCVADLVLHLIRYGKNLDVDLPIILLLAVKHTTNLTGPSADSTSGWSRLSDRLRAQGRIQWCSILGELTSRNHGLVSRLLYDDVPLCAWQFVNISVASVQVVREILCKLAEVFCQSKQDKVTRLSNVFIMDFLLERIDFRRLSTDNKAWSALFKEVVVPKFYKTAESFSRSEELKAASLSLMLTILSRAPKFYYDSNFQSFFNKRVLKHMNEVKKVTHSLEIVLRSLRSNAFVRPVAGWDAFECYVPYCRYTHAPSPYQNTSTLSRKVLESLFIEIFEKPKSKALGLLYDPVVGSPSPTSEAIIASSAHHHHGFNGHLARSSTVSSGTTGASSLTSSSSYSSSVHSAGSSVLLSALRGGNLSFSVTGIVNFRAMYSLPRNIRVCKHILLQIASHDLDLFAKRCLPFLLQLPEDLNKLTNTHANRTILAMHTLWDIFNSGYSGFRSTAYSVTTLNKLEPVLQMLDKRLPEMLEAFNTVFGTNVIGQSEYTLIPTVLWDQSKKQYAVMDEESDGAGMKIKDITGDQLGFPFSWADPDRALQDACASLFTSDGTALELHMLSFNGDVFDTPTGAFRVRDLCDKLAAQIQMEQSARSRRAVYKKRVHGGLDVFREILYCLPVLSCSPVLTDHEPKLRIPPISLLLHLDWNVATAASHCFQRIIACTRSNKLRITILTKLVISTSKAIGPGANSVRAVLTLLRQLLLLLRLWIHIRKDSPSIITMETGWADRFLELCLALLAIPCTVIRLHAVEVIECSRILWPQDTACDVVLGIITTHQLGKFQCSLGPECACGLTSPSPADVMFNSSSNNNSSNNLSSASFSGHRSSFSSKRRNDSTTNSGGSGYTRRASERHLNSSNRSESTANSTASVAYASKGSTGSFENIFTFVPGGQGYCGDDCFLWYPSSVTNQAEEISRNGSNPYLLLRDACTEKDSQWKLDLISIAHRLVDCGSSIHHILFGANGLLLSWLRRLPPFASEVLGYHVSLRRNISHLALALAGCDPANCAYSPHSVNPSHAKWPGQLEPAIEKLTNELWDAAENVLPQSQTKAVLRHTLEELVGQSAHQNCVGRFVELLLEWRSKRVGGLQREAEVVARNQKSEMENMQNEKMNKFVQFLRRGTNPTNGEATMQYQLEDTCDVSNMDIRARITNVEKINAGVLRLLLCQYPNLPGWEPALRKCFELLGQLTKTDLLQDGDFVVAMEFAKLVLQSATCLAKELSYLEGMDSVIRRADSVWPRAERRRVWKLMRQLGGFDELKLFGSQNSPISPALSPPPVGLTPITGPNTAGLTSPSPRSRIISGKSTTERKIIAEEDFQRLRDLTTRTAAHMLQVGPVSLGTVAPRPDEMLWDWLFYDELQQDREPRLLASYLTAHWHVGDIESAGGGTFGPFLDRWYKESSPVNMSPTSARNADAIFYAVCDAVQVWLFQGANYEFVAPIEATAMGPVTFLALLQARTHPHVMGRVNAFRLLDIVERSSYLSSNQNRGTLLRNFDFHQGSDLGVLTFCEDLECIEGNAVRASELLTECCPDLAPVILYEFCQRLPSLSSSSAQDRLVTGAVEVILSWCRNSSTKVSPLSSEVLSKQQQKPEGTDEDLRKSLVAQMMNVHKMVSLQDIWVLSVHFQATLEVLLPVWRALCIHHPSIVVDFLVSKLLLVQNAHLEKDDSINGEEGRAIASFIISGISIQLFRDSPCIVLNQLVVNVLNQISIETISKLLFSKQNTKNKSVNVLCDPSAVHEWVSLALTTSAYSFGMGGEMDSEEDVSVIHFEQLLSIQRCVLKALNICSAVDRKECSRAFPIMLTFSLVGSVVLINQPEQMKVGGFAKLEDPEESYSPEHQCLSTLLLSILHERCFLPSSGTDGDKVKGKLISSARILSLSKVRPAHYDNDELADVVDCLVELLDYCDDTGHLIHVWLQCLLLNALGLLLKQMQYNTEIMVRCLKVYRLLRSRVSVLKIFLKTEKGDVVMLVDEDSFQIEMLALLRILHQSVKFGLNTVQRVVVECMLEANMTEYLNKNGGQKITMIMLTAFTHVSDPQTEALVLKLLTRLPVNSLEPPLTSAGPLSEKLKQRLSDLFSSTTVGKVSSPVLSLLTRLQALKSPLVPFASYLTLLLPFLSLNPTRSSSYHSLILDTILSLDHLLPENVLHGLTAFATTKPTRSSGEDVEQIRGDLIGSIADSFGVDAVASCLVHQFFVQMNAAAAALLEEDGGKCLLTCIEWCTALIDRKPESLSHLTEIVALSAYPSEEIDCFNVDLRQGFEKLVRSACKASVQPCNSLAARKSRMSSVTRGSTGSFSELQVLGNMESLIVSFAEGLDVAVKQYAKVDAVSSVLPPALFMQELKSALVHPTRKLRATSSVTTGYDEEDDVAVQSSRSRHSLSILQAKQRQQDDDAVDSDTNGGGDVMGGEDEEESGDCFSGGCASFEGSKHLPNMNKEDLVEQEAEELEEREQLQHVPDISNSGEVSTSSSSGSGSSITRRRFVEDLLKEERRRRQIASFITQESIMMELTWLEFALSVVDFKVKVVEEKGEIVESAHMAQLICDKFIVLDSLDTVEIDMDTRENILNEMREVNVSVDLFKPAMDLALDYLEDCGFLGRFLRSIQYCDDN